MTVADLITAVLDALRSQLYADAPAAHWFRDKTALTKAISRYGYACDQRGWQFDVPFLLKEIMGIVVVVKRQQITGYLPVYLSEAIDQHIREHAEELNTKAKAIRTVAEKNIGKLHVNQPPVGPSATELLALLHIDLKRQAKARRKPAVKSTQPTLL